MSKKIGFVSAILAEKSFEEVVDFAAENGFGYVEMMCWPKGKAERRYAGVTHIDCDTINEIEAKKINNYLKNKNVKISALGYYPNPLDADIEKRNTFIAHIFKIIETVKLLGIENVNTFVGRDVMATYSQNIELFKQYWLPIIRFAEKNKIKIGIENCPMYFTQDEWPNGKNMAISPKVWQELFEIANSEYFGLNYDPSHMVWQHMDYVEPIKNFSHKIFHLHLKDVAINKQKLNTLGILAHPLEYHDPRLPGRGDIDWTIFLKQIQDCGLLQNPLIIEFEDKAYEGDINLITKGLKETKQFIEQILKQI